jgi:hypothetical protein
MGRTRRQGSRVRAGARHATTVAIQRTYTVQGQVYSRLLFHLEDQERYIPDEHRSIPLTDNLYQMGPTQMDLRDYPMLPEFRLLEGGKRGKELEKVSPETDGTFAFTTELRPGKPFRIEALLRTGERMFNERVTVLFRVKKIPMGLDWGSVKVSVVHEIEHKPKKFKTIDKEKLTATIEGSTLWLMSYAAIVFDTFALEVEYMSQHLSTKGKLEYHTFEYDKQQYRIELQHLCLSTCTAIMLNYYEVQIKGNPITIQQVAEAATRAFLDVHTRKAKKPQGFDKQLDPKAGDIVKFTDGSYPYNLEAFLTIGVKSLMAKAGIKSRWWFVSDTQNLMKTNWPDLKCYLAFGWPTVMADDLKGNWEHARICTGLVVDHTGKIVECYVIDPGRKDRLTIKTDGKQSDLGWILLSMETKQSEVSPKRLYGGGELPASRRLTHP